MEEKIKEFLKEEGLVLPKELIFEAYKETLKFAGALSGILQAGSKRAGKRAGEIFRNWLKQTNFETTEILETFLRESGVAKVKVLKLENGFSIKIIDSFLLKAHDKFEVAIRPIIGAIEGFLEGFEGKAYTSKIKNGEIIVEEKL
ncbi:MAG: hypothetical protein N2504_01740 [candidate division WOR-3 bacterium]|nr:hypothetical protein [candidate division WOR-3 bacterium]MCX7947293.1 hypothetical protein [candidate division WOR-3 bacterium]MDW8150150.1 hypothetical protein [candidate division WOR-3 bacterium]